MINIEHQARSLALLEEIKRKRREKHEEERKKRLEAVQPLITAASEILPAREKDELTAVVINRSENKVRLGEEFRYILEEKGVKYENSRRVLLDFIELLSGQRTSSVIKGIRKDTHTFDIGNFIPGALLVRYESADEINRRQISVHYAFVKNE